MIMYHKTYTPFFPRKKKKTKCVFLFEGRENCFPIKQIWGTKNFTSVNYRTELILGRSMVRQITPCGRKIDFEFFVNFVTFSKYNFRPKLSRYYSNVFSSISLVPEDDFYRIFDPILKQLKIYIFLTKTYPSLQTIHFKNDFSSTIFSEPSIFTVEINRM